MPGARFVVPSLPGEGETRTLGRDKAAHARARRLAPGNPVVLVDGSGREAHGRVKLLGRGGLEIAIERVAAAPPPDVAPITVLASAVRLERLSWIAEKATELGAATLRVIISERTQSPRAGADIVARLRRVVEEAAEQSDSVRWPRIEEPQPFSSVLERDETSQRFFLDANGAAFPASLPRRPTSLLIGPEGGWTDAERAAAIAAGWVVVSIPAGKLRAETAAVAGLVLAKAALARAELARGSH